ncbi:MAG: iron-sulfur cluster assembly accessory protein [Thermoguttaceae bacterium]|nr:iron-sulfur cluster assembly accessory protein [Thermoguttaceae bacterium]MDW8037442.1 iron-sulfur cluster assembly accessory protein [Thermoguttaceae bacterium]
MGITLTESARNEIVRIIKSQGLASQTALRISIEGGGCSGLQYRLTLDEQFDPAVDVRYPGPDVAVVTRKKFALHLDGTTIDFQETPLGRGFAIENPNYPRWGGCPGCGAP